MLAPLVQRLQHALRALVVLDAADLCLSEETPRVDALHATLALDGPELSILHVAAASAAAPSPADASAARVDASGRLSLDAPFDYVESNLTGHLTVLEGCRRTGVAHLVYASSSSVYGLNATPFRASDRTDHPVSLYGATKKANEVMTHAYAHLFGVPATGLRFFTVYGPWGRPDMATMKFTRAILAGDPIDVYGHGEMKRDFTYVGDIADSVVALLDRAPEADPAWTPDGGDPAASSAPPMPRPCSPGRT